MSEPFSMEEIMFFCILFFAVFSALALFRIFMTLDALNYMLDKFDAEYEMKIYRRAYADAAKDKTINN